MLLKVDKIWYTFPVGENNTQFGLVQKLKTTICMELHLQFISQ